jgi:acyl-coenzyme A synthetase/AMP-(fatty) acid ligase
MRFRDAFLAHVDLAPDAPALHWQGRDVSYGELSDLAGRARDRLDELDLGPDEPVGVLGRKSPAAVALVLACLLARRRFLLPSPALGEHPLALLFAQAGCRHVVVPEGDAPYETPADEVFPPVLRVVEHNDVSFMLTTSGSTGLPKIVPLGRAGVDRFLDWAGRTFEIGPGRTVLNYAPLNFDLCLLDVWTTLAWGGRVLLVDPDHAVNGRHLLELLAQHDVHVVQAVPMLFGVLAEAAAGRRLPAVRHVMFTGDVLPDKTLARLPELFPAARIYNIYGCTETNDSFIHEVDPAQGSPVPIGRPLPGVHTLVVDEDGAALTGPGVGELHVSTPFQTAGYLDKARNADKFATRDGRRWFRTGDLVRVEPDGRTFLVGRNDFQVKVRGVAVNTAEVERVLLAHPDVVEAAVAAQPDPVAGRRLVSVVRRTAASGLNSLGLLEHCVRRLPRAAVPSTLQIVDHPLPRTATGKVDRSAVALFRESPTVPTGRRKP